MIALDPGLLRCAGVALGHLAALGLIGLGAMLQRGGAARADRRAARCLET